MNNTNNVKLTINESGLIKNLSSVFTDKTKVLIELAQNSRRSSSEFVSFNYEVETSTLTVTDKGCGIEDLQNLLSIALSGWSEEIKSSESAYGMGFLSTLFSCEKVEITSGLQKISSTTEDILNQKEISIIELENSEKVNGTIIKLYGFDYSIEEFKAIMHCIAQAYPIKVIANDVVMDRPKSIEVLSGSYESCEFEFGMLYFPKDHLPNGYNCYLQGIHILSSYSKSDGIFSRDLKGVYVHLNNEVKARMPDRDNLLEADVIEKSIEGSIIRFYKRKLEKLLLDMGDEDFMDKYDDTTVRYHPELLNKIPLLPRTLFKEIVQTPSFEGFVCDFLQKPSKPLSKEALAKKERHLVDMKTPSHWDGDNFQESMYAYLLDAYVVDVEEVSQSLSSEHWVFDFVTELNEDNVFTDIINETKDVYLSGKIVCCNVVFCDQYQITGPLGTVSCDDRSINIGDENLYVPMSCNSGDGVNQMSNFRGEFDDDLDDLRDLDESELSQLIARNKANSKSEFLMLALEVLKHNVKNELKGCDFSLSFDSEGNISVTENSKNKK